MRKHRMSLLSCVRNIIVSMRYLEHFHTLNQVHRSLLKVVVTIVALFIQLRLRMSMLYEVYVVHSTIIFPGSRVSDFARNLRAQKLNKAHRQSERT